VEGDYRGRVAISQAALRPSRERAQRLDGQVGGTHYDDVVGGRAWPVAEVRLEADREDDRRTADDVEFVECYRPGLASTYVWYEWPAVLVASMGRAFT
jgi:hypothetical protein